MRWGSSPFGRLASQLPGLQKHPSAGESLKTAQVRISQLGGLSGVPLASLCRHSERIQSTIPVFISGQLTLQLTNSDASVRCDHQDLVLLRDSLGAAALVFRVASQNRLARYLCSIPMLSAEISSTSSSWRGFDCIRGDKAAEFDTSPVQQEYLIRPSCALLLRASSLSLPRSQRRANSGERGGAQRGARQQAHKRHLLWKLRPCSSPISGKTCSVVGRRSER